MKIQYNDIERISQEMLGYVSNIEGKLTSFRKRTEGFAESMQDEISQSAIALVQEISAQVKQLRTSIENGVTIVGNAMEVLDDDEENISGEINSL
jgi:hypothetical protein